MVNKLVTDGLLHKPLAMCGSINECWIPMMFFLVCKGKLNPNQKTCVNNIAFLHLSKMLKSLLFEWHGLYISVKTASTA